MSMPNTSVIFKINTTNKNKINIAILHYRVQIQIMQVDPLSLQS